MDLGTKYSISIAAIFLFLIIVSRFTSSKSKCHTKDMKEKYRKLLEQSKHWYNISKQDSSILLALFDGERNVKVERIDGGCHL